MAKYERFEQTPAWQQAVTLYNARDFRTNFLRNLDPSHPLYKSDEARAARGETL
jgi:hypothetical protein